MADSISVLPTKQCRPAVSADVVPRRKLVKQLQSHANRPLMLVSAPAGYGKSTLASQWLNEDTRISAWISLEKTESSLRVFLTYFVAAIQSVQSGSCKKIQAMIRSRNLPPAIELASVLNTELAELEKPMVLVLDDYHQISESDIHLLLAFQLKHQIEHFQLVILTRRDPPLPMASLQAANLLGELRLGDLMFTLPETDRFLKKTAGGKLTQDQIQELHNALEGWPVGLRLAGVALKKSDDPDQLLGKMPDGLPRIQNYLIEEVLSDMLPVHRDCIGRISLLDRYCEPLNRALCSHACMSCQEEPCMFEQSENMTDSYLWSPLSIPLDADGEWFRYHHQFESLLRQQYLKKAGKGEAEVVYRTASKWLEEHGYIDEAIRYGLKVSPETGLNIVVRHRRDAMNKEQWVRLRHWIDLLPAHMSDTAPEILLLQAWCAIGYPEMFEMLERIQNVLSSDESNHLGDHLRGELLAYSALGHYVKSDAEKTIGTAESAMGLLQPDQLSERGFAHILCALGLQMQGRFAEGRHQVLQALQDRVILNTTYHARLLCALCFGYWIDADAKQLGDAAKEYLTLGQTLGLSETIEHALNFRGLFHYARNELDPAAANWQEVVDNPEISNLHNYLHCTYALAILHHFQGNQDLALERAQRAVSLAFQSHNPTALMQSKAFEAELALRQGHLAEAERWLLEFNDSGQPLTLYRFYVPRFTKVRVLIALNRDETLLEAIEESRELMDQTERIHNRHFLIISQVLHALALDTAGRGAEALDMLGRAVKQAQPGGGIRYFIDEGPRVVALLGQLDLDTEGVRFVGRIRAGCRPLQDLPAASSGGTDIAMGLLDPLSVREREVLELMARHLKNKEIAERLFIAPGTVKRHTNNIFSKLAVHSREEVVAKARALGLLGN